MKLIEDFTLNSEYTKRIFARQSNKVYSKRIEDKGYKVFRKFKNATKAKKFFIKFINDNPLMRIGNYYLSSK